MTTMLSKVELPDYEEQSRIQHSTISRNDFLVLQSKASFKFVLEKVLALTQEERRPRAKIDQAGPSVTQHSPV
jgi:hypothetical protein